MKKLISMIAGLLIGTSIVAADMMGPGVLLIGAGIVFLVFAGFVVGAVFLIRWIIRKTKHEQKQGSEKQ